MTVAFSVAPLPQAQQAFFAGRRNSQGHDHHFARVRLGVEKDHGQSLVVEPTLGQPLDFRRRGPHKTAANARLLHTEALASQLDDLLVTPRRNAVHQVVESRLR